MESSKSIPKQLSRRNVYSSSWLDLNLDKVQYSSGKIIEDYHIIDFKFDSIVVLITNKNNEVCFIRSPRYATQSVELELPSGGIMPGESIEDAATREVLEETGFRLVEPETIYSFHPSNAVSKVLSHIVIGRVDYSNQVSDFDDNEVLEVLWIDQKQILGLIQGKKIKDGFALTTLLLYHFLYK